MKPGPRPKEGPRERNGRSKRLTSAFKDPVWKAYTVMYLRSIAKGQNV